MSACLCRRFIIGNGEIMLFCGIILASGKFIPSAGGHILTHSHIYNSRLETASDGLIAIHRITLGIIGITHNPYVRTSLVLYRMVKFDGHITAK